MTSIPRLAPAAAKAGALSTLRIASATRIAAISAIAAAVLAPGVATAQAVPEGGHGVVTMTRGMRIFSDGESHVIAALKAHDAAALDRWVTADFEQRSQPMPGQPLPREDWVKEAPAAAAASVGFRQMAVHDLGDTAIVSFQWLHPAPDFVVDVWRKKTGSEDWQLAIRYLSGAPAGAPNVAPLATGSSAAAGFSAGRAGAEPATSAPEPKR